MNRLWVIAAACLGFMAVALGAYGAHGLERWLTGRGLEGPGLAKAMHDYEVAVRYQMHHALAMLSLACASLAMTQAPRSPAELLQATGKPRVGPGFALHAACGAWMIGVLVFSGTLYTIVFTGDRWWGRITPIGGLLLLVGWACAAAWAIASPRSSAPR